MSVLTSDGQIQMLRVTLRKSPIGFSKDQKATAKALGLTRINQTVTHPNNSSVQGMANKIRHLVEVELVGESGAQ